jgi:hypothetical protein
MCVDGTVGFGHMEMKIVQRHREKKPGNQKTGSQPSLQHHGGTVSMHCPLRLCSRPGLFPGVTGSLSLYRKQNKTTAARTLQRSCEDLTVG